MASVDQGRRDSTLPSAEVCGPTPTASLLRQAAAVLVVVFTTILWGASESASQPATTTSLPDEPISGIPETTSVPPPPVTSTVPPPASLPMLVLALPSGVAGGEARISGRGCPSGAPVTVTIGGRTVGRAVAGALGEFDARLDLREVDVGRRVVTATCGATTIATTLDVVINSTAPAAGSATVAATVAFFVLIGLFAVLVGRSDEPFFRRDSQEKP